MSSTEKRDQLARDLANGVIAYGAGDREEYVADAERQVDGVIAEALRNAATRLEALAAMYGLSGQPDAARYVAVGRAFAASLEADAAALERGPIQPGRSVEEWHEAAGVRRPKTVDEMRDHPRDYVIAMLNEVNVPLDADAQTARDLLLERREWHTTVTDADLESFQALRRQIMAGPDARVDSLVRTLDQLGAGNGMGPAELGDLLVQHRIQVPEHDILRSASDIRCARKD